MKIIHVFPLFFLTYLNSYSQSGCSDAQAHIFYAFNNAKDGLESNNITDVKYYAKKTLESFKSVQHKLGTCECENVENFTYESIQKLSKVPKTEKMSDAKYFVAKAKDYAQKIITSLDYCTISDKSNTPVANVDEVSDLEKEQLKLKQQQEELLKQQEALKQKLNKQKEDELRIEKQHLIAKSNAALLKNITACNEVLNVCQCGNKIPENEINKNEEQLMSKSVDEIRDYYITSIKNLTSNYLNILSSCDAEKTN